MSKVPFEGTLILHNLTILNDVSSPPFVTPLGRIPSFFLPFQRKKLNKMGGCTLIRCDCLQLLQCTIVFSIRSHASAPVRFIELIEEGCEGVPILVFLTVTSLAATSLVVFFVEGLGRGWWLERENFGSERDVWAAAALWAPSANGN